MGIDRREFLKRTAAIAGVTLLGGSSIARAAEKKDFSKFFTNNTVNERDWKIWEEKKNQHFSGEPYGILVDTTFCIGCRRCEWACNNWNKNPNQSIEKFESSVNEKNSVFNEVRRTHAGSFTVVNRFEEKEHDPIYVKKQCMHCVDPACLNACFVDAFRKTPEGPVIYNPNVCIGCRYCMVSCPFGIPAYEYYSAFHPQITKCTMCYDRVVNGQMPACVENCPAGALTFGSRSQLIKLAHERIANNPGRYINHVYGEQEVGGTSWLYLSPVEFNHIGFQTNIGKTPVPDLTKGYLLGVKIFEMVSAWPLVFGAYYAVSKLRERKNEKHGEETPNTGKKS
jgi:Fe-S-cluster-containing dehydrogenase component